MCWPNSRSIGTGYLLVTMTTKVIEDDIASLMDLYHGFFFRINRTVWYSLFVARV